MYSPGPPTRGHSGQQHPPIPRFTERRKRPRDHLPYQATEEVFSGRGDVRRFGSLVVGGWLGPGSPPEVYAELVDQVEPDGLPRALLSWP